jgi:hypothetical protein
LPGICAWSSLFRSLQHLVQFEDPEIVSGRKCVLQSHRGRKPWANHGIEQGRYAFVSAERRCMLLGAFAGPCLPARLSGCGAHCRTRAWHSLLTLTRCELACIRHYVACRVRRFAYLPSQRARKPRSPSNKQKNVFFLKGRKFRHGCLDRLVNPVPQSPMH